jgi:hypothetical protein
VAGGFDGDKRIVADKNPLLSPLNSMRLDPNILAEIAEQFLANLLDFVKNVIIDNILNLLEQLTGIDFSGWIEFLDGFADQLGLGDFGNFLDFFGLFSDLFGGIDLTNISSLNPVTILTNWVSTMLGPLGLLLTGDSPLDAFNLFGQIPASLFGLFPASSITSASPNLLANSGFDGSISMDGTGGWTWDSTTGHTTNGSAKTTANGTQKALLSNAVDVAPGQAIDLGAWTKSASYVGTGTPIRVGVRTYFYNTTTGITTAVATTNVTSVAGPGTSWTHVTGTYTVPSNGTVNQVRLRLVVDTTATGGTIWFDDAEISKPGNGPFDGILDLFGLNILDDLFNVNITTIWTNIISTFLNPLGLFQDHGARTGLFGGTSILSNILPGVVGGVSPGTSLLDDVGDFLTNMFNGITRSAASAATQADTAVAVAGQADTVVGTAATMEQIMAALGSGNPDSDDFERVSSTNLGANWNIQQTGTGVLATPNGHDANFTGTGNVEFTARKTNILASTNHQVSTIVLATAIPSYPFFTPLPYGGNIDLWVRMSAFTTWATRTGLRFRINSAAPYQATWFIHWVNSGTETQLATNTMSIPAAGASISFEVGVGGNTLAYQARVNGSPVANFTDSTNKGLGNTGRGFGGKGTAGFGTPQGVPNVKQWTAQG